MGKICIKQKGWTTTWFESAPRESFSIILAGHISMNPNLPYPLKSLTGVYVLLGAVPQHHNERIGLVYKMVY